jgi:hypothetical protein
VIELEDGEEEMEREGGWSLTRVISARWRKPLETMS